ncbi:MAG: hypothetical protein HOH34_02470 [Flavobacteriales bacterium]|nr:hypothetical protein [Flavobacteriales bacterium]
MDDLDDIEDEFTQYWQDQKVEALGRICEEEQLDKEQFNALIEAYIYSGINPIRDDVLNCLNNKPSVLKSVQIGERIIDRMQDYIDVFVNDMVA